MPILALVRIPGDYATAKKVMESRPDLVAEIMEHADRYGGKIIGHLVGDDTFVSMDEWPSREAYAGYKVDARDAIQRWNRELGIEHLTDAIWEDEEIWEFDPPPAGS